ncbi:MAG: biliverdin-producing heme oxygenase [Thermoanaerobaculaceae bacterium]|jgi:heme oxygenase
MKLSELLRERTADAHRGAERSEFVARFVRGGLDREMYFRHLLALHGVYTALEDALERLQDDPRLGAFLLPQLWRSLALERDLDFLRGPRWHAQEPVPAAKAYVERLRWVESAEPIRLVSHSYVRYLGDLSGGQVLSGLAARQLDLVGDGLRFYEFPAIPDRAVFKADYRRRLDELPLTDGEREAVVEEARTAFRLNAAIFDQLLS